MKAYFLPLGDGADQALSAVMTAMSCGAAKQASSIRMLRVPAATASPLPDRLMADLNTCHHLFEGTEEFAFFRTRWRSAIWQPALPDRDALVENEESRLLLRALRGEGVPFSFRTDREAAEWSMSALLDRIPRNPEDAEDDWKPFLSFLSEMEQDLNRGEEVRAIALFDPAEGYAAGIALALSRFLRERFPEDTLFLGLIASLRSPLSEEDARGLRSLLAALDHRNLVRAAEGRDTSGADACWLLGLPASLKSEGGSSRLTDWAAARALGEIWSGETPPAPGLHTREIPGIITLQTLDQETKPAAAFLRGAVWSLCDILPSLSSYFDHPALLRSLAPATRGGLFRRLFRDQDSGVSRPPELSVLDRALRACCLEILSLLQSLPPLMKEAKPATALWQQMVNACGRAVTLASEYDTRRKEAEDSGIDKVQPVHRASMADTAEEELLRKLDQMASELSEALSARAEIFQKAGGYLSRAALRDCLAKCDSARKNAEAKLVAMPAGTPEERYALGLQERRVRMLKAAIVRCEKDLAEAASWPALSLPGTLRPAAPFAGEILDPALAEQLMTLLTGEGDAAAAAAKSLRDGIGGLLTGYTLNDAKTLLKNLLSVCRAPEAEAPLCSLMTGVFSVCGVEVSGLRFQSRGDLPAMPLLPDLTASEVYFPLSAAADHILAPAAEDRTAVQRGLLALLLLREYRRRNLNDAALELIPLRGESSALTRVYLSSRGVREAALCVLRGGEGETARRQPVAVLLPGQGLEPGRLSKDSLDLIPSFAFWLDRETLTFLDPCPWLSEGDRQILTEQLTRLRAALNGAAEHAFSAFLSDFHQDISRAGRTDAEDNGLRIRLRVACGLHRLPIWQKELQRVSAFYETSLPGDPVCGALAGRESFEAAEPRVREDILYTFRETPIARENALQLLEPTRAPGEEYTLNSLNTECDILFHSSDDYHEALAEGLEALLQRYPGADPEAVSVAEKLLAEAREPIADAVTELTWPWDTVSASVMTILTECLGKELAAPALRAFSNLLAVFPARGGEILGDVLLGKMCVIPRESPEEDQKTEGSAEIVFRDAESAFPPDAQNLPVGSPEVSAPDSLSPVTDPSLSGAPAESPVSETAAPQVHPDAVLPPLSPDFARALCRSPRGQSLLSAEFLRFEPEGANVRVILTLEGAFTLKLIRVYGPEEIHYFYAHDLPTLALWPSLPFAPESWHTYTSFAHCPPEFGVIAVSREEEAPLSGSAPRLSVCQETFPLCYLLSWEGKQIGAVPNLLPAPEIPEGDAWTACLDFGAAATAVIFTDGESRWPMQGPVTVRTLLRSPAATEDLLWREFLPAVPVSALLPSALRIFQNSLNEEDLPLRDGAIFMSASLRDVLEVSPEALYTDLKWAGEKGRAAGMYLHQAMLMAALQARCGGARTLGWRAALPEEMAPEGRERLVGLFQNLAALVSRESGIPLPEKDPPVAFAQESTALGAYFRFCSPDQTRGGFMTLDVGADTADLSLYLQGREDAVRACQLPLGVHNMLLPALLRRPEILREDFGYIEQADFQRDLADLQALLEKARRDPSALRQARYGLDAILADHFPVFLQSLAERRAAGSPGRTGSLILLQESFLMMLAGLILLQISGDSLRNDTLPDTMTLFLAGRGSLMMESLSMQAKTSLWKILTMFRNNRVRALTLVFSAEKKLEIPVGLSVLPRPAAVPPRPAASPAAIAVRPEELMPEFLLRFRREFPEEAALLFPGIYANDYYMPFTPYGQQLLSQALQAAFGGREAGQPVPALVSCLAHLMEMIEEGVPLS